MAILVLTHPLPAAPFAAAMRAAAPAGLAVWTEEDAPPPDKVEALLAWRLKAGVASRYPNLRVVCSIGAGVDKLIGAPDLPPDVAVTRVVDPLQAQTMAQYVVACALRFTRELPRYEAQQARSEWKRHEVRPTSSCRVGILGQGEVAQAVVHAFAPLGYPVAVWGRTRRDWPGLESFAGDDELATMLGRTDVLVCTLPLTDATRGLLDRRRLSQLPRGAYLINVGRGEQVVEDDLRALLDDSHLAGAALDVFEREPPRPEHWIWRHPRVFATPHIAGEARDEVVGVQCLDALRRAREGLPQLLAVNRAAGY